MARTGTTSLVAIAAGGAALVVVAVVGVVVAMRSCSGDEPRAATPSANDHARVADEGMHARGTAELRQLGCDHALVVDMAQLLGDAARVREGEPRIMVTCDVAPATTPPSCERVAAAYFGAISGTAEDRIGVRVTREGSPSAACSRLYAPNGADLGAF
jgi:hypothetical protein